MRPNSNTIYPRLTQIKNRKPITKYNSENYPLSVEENGFRVYVK